MSVIPGFSSRKTNVFDPLSLEFWDPLDRCPFLKDLISSPFSAEAPTRSSPAVRARVDWREARDKHVIKADLPGLRKEDVKLEVEDGRVLTITGERKEEDEAGEGDTWHRMERGRGSFYRRFEMPRDVKLDEVKAEMENGVLTVVVPKVEEKKPEVKLIQIEG